MGRPKGAKNKSTLAKEAAAAAAKKKRRPDSEFFFWTECCSGLGGLGYKQFIGHDHEWPIEKWNAASPLEGSRVTSVVCTAQLPLAVDRWDQDLSIGIQYCYSRPGLVRRYCGIGDLTNSLLITNVSKNAHNH